MSLDAAPRPRRSSRRTRSTALGRGSGVWSLVARSSGTVWASWATRPGDGRAPSHPSVTGGRRPRPSAALSCGRPRAPPEPGGRAGRPASRSRSSAPSVCPAAGAESPVDDDVAEPGQSRHEPERRQEPRQRTRSKNDRDEGLMEGVEQRDRTRPDLPPPPGLPEAEQHGEVAAVIPNPSTGRRPRLLLGRRRRWRRPRARGRERSRGDGGAGGRLDREAARLQGCRGDDRRPRLRRRPRRRRPRGWASSG